MNQFSDLNPYEPPPIRAELSQPEPRAKRWTPYGSFIVALFGPVGFIVLLRYLVEIGIIDIEDPLRFFAIGTAAFIWLVGTIRSLVWVVAYSWR